MASHGGDRSDRETSILIPIHRLFASAFFAVSRGVLDAAPHVHEKFMRFVPGGWNSNEWTAIRLANQEHAVPLVQKAALIGTTTNTFDKTDYSKEHDNALLLYDTGTTKREIEITLGLGAGFQGHSTPGVCLSPVVKDGVFQNGIVVFASTSAVVVWHQYAEGDRMRCRRLGKLVRRTNPSAKHTLRCRFSKKEKSIGIRLDDSDIVVFRFVGDKRLSNIDPEFNSSVVFWGCHGACDFLEMKVRAIQPNDGR